MEKIKVCETADSFYPCIDGVMHAVNNYCKKINEKTDCKLVVPAASKKSNYKDNFSYEVIRCKSMSAPENYRLGLPAFDAKLKKRLKSEQFDIIHAHTPFTMSRFFLRHAKKNGIPMVITLHTKFHEDFNRTLKGFKPLCWFMMKYIMYAFNRADSVWVVGEKVQDVLRDYGYKGEIEVVKNGTDFNYPSNAEQLIQRVNQIHSIENEENVFVFVGRIALYKNINLLAESLKILKERGMSFKILMVGGGFDLEEYKKTVEKLGLKDNFIFVGAVNDRELLQAYYLRGDLFLFPSVFDNGPLVCIEAAAHKIPCVVIEDSCASEGIIDGKNGYLAKENALSYADRIQSAMADKTAISKVGEDAYSTLYRSWDTVRDEVIEKYQKIIKEYKNKGKKNV